MALTEDGTADGQDAPATHEEIVRERAIKQIECRRRFHIEVVAWSIGMFLLVVIWATSEYHNAGGWPTNGFSQSSAIPHVWNVWILYPLIAWLVIMGARARAVYGHRPISDTDIEREIQRQTGTRRR